MCVCMCVRAFVCVCVGVCLCMPACVCVYALSAQLLRSREENVLRNVKWTALSHKVKPLNSSCTAFLDSFMDILRQFAIPVDVPNVSRLCQHFSRPSSECTSDVYEELGGLCIFTLPPLSVFCVFSAFSTCLYLHSLTNVRTV